MSTLPPQSVAIQCPNCRTSYQAQVFQLIDVGQSPELKQALLSGRVNVAICPQCGVGGMLQAPMLYHDPAKQFLFVLFPAEVKASPEEQEQFIGALTQLVMRSLPADAPKGYLLTPQRFMSLTSMLDAILEGEGIPREALEAQRKRSELFAQLLEAGDDDQALKKIVDANKAALDYEFFLTIAAYIEAAQQDGDDEASERFTRLRDRLIELTGFDAKAEGLIEPDVSEVVAALLDAEEAHLPALIAEHRPVLDYGFYEALAERIDEARRAGNDAEAARIEQRRDLVLETTEKMDRDAQALFEGAAQTLNEVLTADDTRAALLERRAKLDEAFMLVAGLNAQQAEQSGNSTMAERLREIQQQAAEVVQESLTPEERLIGHLLGAEKPQDATKLLRKNASMINSDFVKRLNDMADEMDEGGRKEVADRLRQLGREAASMLF